LALLGLGVGAEDEADVIRREHPLAVEASGDDLFWGEGVVLLRDDDEKLLRDVEGGGEAVQAILEAHGLTFEKGWRGVPVAWDS